MQSLESLEAALLAETRRNIELIDALFKSDRQIEKLKRDYLAVLLSDRSVYPAAKSKEMRSDAP